MNAQKVEDMLGRAVASCRLLVLGDGAIEAAAPARGAAAPLSSRPCPRPRAGLHVRAPRAPSSAAAAAAAPGLRPNAPRAGPPRAAPAPAPAPAEPGDAGPAALGVAVCPGSARQLPMRGARPTRVPGAAGPGVGPGTGGGGRQRGRHAGAVPLDGDRDGWALPQPGYLAGRPGHGSRKFVDLRCVARRPSLQRWDPSCGHRSLSKYRVPWTLSPEVTPVLGCALENPGPRRA